MMKQVVPIQIPQSQLEAICQKWQIVKLALFGSVLRDDFSENSDVDVLVCFNEPITLTFANWDAIEQELAELFGRDVDLVDWKAIEKSPNYIRRKEILNSAEVIYAI